MCKLDRMMSSLFFDVRTGMGSEEDWSDNYIYVCMLAVLEIFENQSSCRKELSRKPCQCMCQVVVLTTAWSRVPWVMFFLWERRVDVFFRQGGCQVW